MYMEIFQNFVVFSLLTLFFRNEDSHHFFDDKTNDIHSNKRFQKLWLDRKFKYVDDPAWTCDSQKACLQPEFNQGYISGILLLLSNYMLSQCITYSISTPS